MTQMHASASFTEVPWEAATLGAGGFQAPDPVSRNLQPSLLLSLNVNKAFPCFHSDSCLNSFLCEVKNLQAVGCLGAPFQVLLCDSVFYYCFNWVVSYYNYIFCYKPSLTFFEDRQSVKIQSPTLSSNSSKNMSTSSSEKTRIYQVQLVFKCLRNSQRRNFCCK